MDHMYAAMPPKHLNATEKPSGSSPVAVCMRDHNFSRPPADLPDNGKELNVQYSPKSSRVNSPTTRERNLPGQNSRRKSDLFATSACTTTSRSSTAEADEDEIDNEEDSDERDDNFIPVATVASAPNSPARMRSLLAEYLLSATAAHPQHEVPCTDKEMGAEDNTDSSAQGQQQLDTSCAASVDDTLLDEAEDCDRLVDETEKDKNQSTLSQQQSKNAVHRNTEKGGGPTLIDTGIETVGKAVTNVDKGAPATEKIITNADGNFHRWSAISSVDNKITNVEDDVEQCSDVPQQEETSEMDTSVSETNTHVLESDSFKSTLNVPKVSTTTTSDDDSDISHDALQVGGVSNSTCSNSTTNAASCSQSCSISSIKSEIITSDEESAINTRTGSHRVQSSAKGSTRSHNVIVKLETEEKSDTLPTSQGYSTIVTPCVSEQPKAVATLKRKALTGKHSPQKTYISVKTGPFGLEYKSVSESKLERQPGKLQTSTAPSAPVITRKPCRKRTSGQAGLDASGDAQSITAVRVSCGSMSASPSDSFSTTADGSSIKIVDAAASTPTKLKKLSLSGNTPLSKKVFFPQAESSLDTSLFLVPLKKHGWKRELVLRGVFGEDVNKKNPPADTYYFTPDGKKLRSRVEVSKFLDNHPETGLTIDNFTFLKKAISEEPYETVRQAGGSCGRKPKVSGTNSSPKIPKTKVKVGSGSATKDSAKPRQVSQSYNPSSKSSYVSFHDNGYDDDESDDDDEEYHPWDNEKPLVWHKRQKGRRRKSRKMMERSYSPEEEDREVLIQSMPEPDIIIDRAEDASFDMDVANSSCGFHKNAEDGKSPRMMLLPGEIKTESDSEGEVRGSVQLHHSPVKPVRHSSKSTARKSTTPRMAQIKNCSAVTRDEVPLCSNACPGLDSVPPTLQCAFCMCLFHHQCVNVDPGTQAVLFKCMRCVELPEKSACDNRTRPVPAKPPPPPPSQPLHPPVMVSQPARYVIVNSPLQSTGANMVPQAFSLGLPFPVRPRSQDCAVSQQANTVGFMNIINNGSWVRPPQLTVGAAPASLPPFLPLPVGQSDKAGNFTNVACGVVRPLPRLIAAPGVPGPRSSAASTAVSGARPLSSSAPVRPVLLLASALRQQYQPQLMTLPPSLLNRLDLTKPLAVKMNNTKVVVPPSCIIKSQDGVKVLLPANTFPVVPGSNGNFSVSISNVTTPSTKPTSPIALPADGEHPTSIFSASTGPSEDRTEANGSECSSTRDNLVRSTSLLKIVKPLNNNGSDAFNDNKACTEGVQKSSPHDVSSDVTAVDEIGDISAVTATDSDKVRANKIIEDVLSDMRNAMNVVSTIVTSSKKNSTESVSGCADTDEKTAGEADTDSVNAATVSNGHASTAVQETGSEHRKRAREVDFTKCSMHRLFGGFDCMLQIFKFLGVKGLLRASQVNRAWLQISRQKCLWQTVHLKEVSVTNWKRAGTFFQTVATHTLNLQDICHPTTTNKTWNCAWSLIAHLPTLISLRTLQFGPVPSTVLHSLAEKLPELERLHAEHISDFCNEEKWTSKCRLDVGKLANSLTNLQDLRLRGVGGLALPTFTFDGSMTELSNLKHLHTLSLTSMQPLRDKEYKFLGDLKLLRVLELGDCPNWTSDTYRLLGELSELKHLRLEYGGEIPDIGVGKALAKLQKLERLELILFVIPSSLGTWLCQLPLLETFVVWPDTSSHGVMPAVINSHTLAAVSAIQQLKTLIWGVVDNRNTSASADEPSSGSQTADSTATTIPLLASEASLELDAERNSGDEISIPLKEFTGKLCETLPNTKVIVTVRSSIESRLDL